MATLRNKIGVATETGLANQLQDQDIANGMGSLRRGLQSGFIGNDITGLAADEASLRADGRNPEADALRQQIGALQQRQSIYAPEVQDVTKIGGVGDALGWAGGAVGQGLASMAQPMAAATGLNALGTVAGLIPHPLAQLASKGLRIAAPVAAWGINARHMKGEVYDDMTRDPTIMANHSAQELNRDATMYGGAAGLLDTALPGMVGHQLGGGGLTKGLLKHGGLRLGGELLGEGATEAAQGYMSTSLRGELNPNRDTSGDMNDRINDFAGGAAGAGPFAVGGHVADAGFRRVGDTAEKVGTKAGQVYDLAMDKLDQSGATDAVKDGAKGVAGFAKGVFGKGKDKVVDLAGDEDGKVTVDSVKGALRDATNGIKSQEGISTEDQAILRGDVPAELQDKLDSPEFEAWATKGHEERTNKVMDHLERMHEAGDPEAQKLFGEINDAMTVPEHTAAVNKASQYVMGHNELAKQLSTAEAFGKIAGVAGKKGGELAAQAGKGAFNFAKSVWAGMQEGAKKNMQGSLEGFDEHEGERQSKLGENYIQKQAAMKKSRDRAELMAGYLGHLAEEEKKKQRYEANAAGAEHMGNYMKNIGYEIADLADSWDLANNDQTNKANAARGARGDSDRQRQAAMKGDPNYGQQLDGPASLLPQQGGKRGQQFGNLALNLNRIVNNMRTAYGDGKAAEAIDQLHSMLPSPHVAPLFDAMRAELQAQVGPQGHKHTAQLRDEGASEVLSKLPQESELRLMAEGINVRSKEGRSVLLDMVEKIATFPSEKTRGMRVALNRLMGQPVVNEMLGVVNAKFNPAENLDGEIVDDRGNAETEVDENWAMDENGEFVQTTDTPNVEKNHAERLVAKGSGPKLYGFDKNKTHRTSSSRADPFAGKKIPKKEMEAWQKENGARAALGEEPLPDPRHTGSGRPRLFVTGRKLHDGTDAVQKKINDMGAMLGVDLTPENAKRIMLQEGNEKAAAALEALSKKAAAGDEAAQERLNDGLESFFENRAGNWTFSAKPVLKVMEEHGYQPGRMLAAFRDYLYQDGEPVKAKQVSDVLNDLIDVQRDGGERATTSRGDPKRQARTSSKMRRLVNEAMRKYFGERSVVVGEQLTNRDEMQMTAPEFIDMARQGDKVIDLARHPDNLDRANKMIDQANILTFKSELSHHKTKEMHIPVGALVYWVKTQKGKTKASNNEDYQGYGSKDVNADYMSAVAEGIAALIQGGLVGVKEGNKTVGAMPYKLNAFGQKEHFSQAAGMAPSLRLATMKAEHFNPAGSQEKPKSPGEYSDMYVFSQANPDMSKSDVLQLMAKIKEEKGTKGYQLALKKAMRKAGLGIDQQTLQGHVNVAIDQMKGEDPYTAEPLEQDDPSSFARAQTLTAAERKHFFGLKDADARDAYISKLKTKHGSEWAAQYDLTGPNGAMLADRSQAFTDRRTTKDAEGNEVTLPGRRANRSGREVAAALTSNDHATPLDFFKPQKDDAQRDDFADVLGRTKEGGQSVYSLRKSDLGVEHATDAVDKAEGRSEPIVQALVDDPSKGLAALESRLRTAQRPAYVEAPETGNPVQDKKAKDAAMNQPVGGIHYLYPAAAALSPDNMQHVMALADMGPEEAVSVKNHMFNLRKAVAAIALDSTMTPKQKIAVAKMIATDDKRDLINLANVTTYLTKVGEGADLGDLEAKGGMPALPKKGLMGDVSKKPIKPTTRPKGGPGGNVLQGPLFDEKGEVAAERMGKSLPRAGVFENRLGDTSQRIIASKMRAPALWKSAQMIMTVVTDVRENGGTKDEALASPHIAAELQNLLTERMRGNQDARRALDYVYASADRTFDTSIGKETDRDIFGMLNDGSSRTLGQYAEYMTGADDVSAAAKLVAKALKKVVPDVPVDGEVMNLNMGGYFNVVGGHIKMNRQVNLNSALSLLHEGVHAATVRAVYLDPELHSALYALLDHVSTERPEIRDVYGLTNTMEFLAEGLTSQSLQSTLKQTKASAVVEKYLGKTFANAWDSLVGLVSKALGLPEQRTAMHQLLDLAGRAMKATAKDGVVKSTPDEHAAAHMRPMVDDAALNKLKDSVRAMMPRADVQDVLDEQFASMDRNAPNTHASALFLSTLEGALLTAKSNGSSVENFDADKAEQVLDMIHKMVKANGAVTFPSQRFNAQNGGTPGSPSTEAQRQEARDYIRKVLGEEVRTEFEDGMGHSGEWVDVDNLIKISTTSAAGTMETAYHESLHAFFSKYVKNNSKVFEVLKSIAEDPKIVERLHALLNGHPAAQAQLADGEERLAYAYQFWAAGKLDLPSLKAKTWFQKLRAMFKRVLGRVSDSERATAVFEALHEGNLSDPSAVGEVLAAEMAKGTWTKSQLQKMDGLTQWVAGKTMASEEVLAKSVSARAQALARELYTNPADEKAGGEGEGYMNAKGRHSKQYSNLFKNLIHGLSDRDLAEVGEHMMKQTELADIPYAPVRKAVMQTRQLNQRFYRYMTDERGMKLGNLGPKYYPRVWSKSALADKPHEFVKMLQDHYPEVLAEGVAASKGKMSDNQVATRILNGILEGGEIMQKAGPQRDDGVLAPYFMSKRVRSLDWLKPEHSAPFQDKNFVKTMTTYYHDGARAAEYTSRFGEKGEMLDSALTEIQNELSGHASKRMDKGEFKTKEERDQWVKRQMRDVRNAVSAMEGTIGKDISPGMRKFNSWMVAYQNLRLLPLMLFSSMVDPMAMVGRGAPMGEALDAYLRGMKEVFQNWGDMFRDQPKQRERDKWELLAEASGIVDVALYTTHVSDEYASVYMTGAAKKMNDTLFKLNGMEAWDRGMRVAATRSAALFIARHKALPDETHSARWLKELGLTPADIHLDDKGHLITDKRELMDKLGITQEDAERQVDKMNYALARWVQGAVLSPNAAHRPAWGSDPHYSMFFHLKQFTYSFHQTVLKRAVNELNYGNLAPLGTFAWYIPVMIASDITKGLIQGGGELPSHMKGMDAAQWMLRAGERGGVLGLGNIAVDASNDMGSVAGPAVEQIIDAFGAPARNTVINAAPLHGLYAEALK
jgi:hypothetical protein